jgi:hypothetical protein
MKAGGDKDGIWTLLESGLQYVTVHSASSAYLSPFLSIGAIVSHVPYIVRIMMSAMAMGRGGAMRRTSEFGQESVLKRLEVGANRKDLFYYLVCQYTIRLNTHFIKAEYRVARNSLRPSAPLLRTLRKMGRWQLLLVRTQQAAFSRRLSITCYSTRQRMSTYRKKLTPHSQVKKSPWTLRD